MNAHHVESILQHVSVISVFVPVTTGIITYKKTNSELKKLFYYLVFTGFVDLFILFLTYRNINYMPVFHVATIIEFLFFAYMFYSTIKSETFKKIVLVCSICYLAFNTYWLIFYGNVYHFNHESRVFQCVLMVFFALSYFNFLSMEISTNPFNFFQTPMFWISLGVLFYFTGNFFLFSFYMRIAVILPVVWALHFILNILTNILFMVSFICRIR